MIQKDRDAGAGLAVAGPMDDPKTQTEKFKKAARELECDEDEARWDERLKKVARAKVPEKPE